MTYDDERVLTLLKEAVPAAPDMPDRVAAVRGVARRQRTALWSQSLGATTAVLAIVGLGSVALHAEHHKFLPAAQVLPGIIEGFQREKTVSFEARSTLTGVPKYDAGNLSFSGEVTGTRTLQATYAGSVDLVTFQAELTLDGAALPFALYLPESGPTSMTMRSDGHRTYRMASKLDHAPAGKTWIEQSGAVDAGPYTLADLPKVLAIVKPYVKEIRATTTATVRGVATQQYDATVDLSSFHQAGFVVHLDVDADGLLRRVESTGPLGLLYGSDGPDTKSATWQVSMDLFDYGHAVHVVAPPASEVITQDALDSANEVRRDNATTAFEQCSGSKPSQATLDRCLVGLGHDLGDGTTCTGTVTAHGSSYQCSDGTGGDASGAQSYQTYPGGTVATPLEVTGGTATMSAQVSPSAAPSP